MGGMIAQIVATKADDRVRSLVSISSTGGESVISAEPEALRQMESFFFPFATAMEALEVIRSSNDYFSHGALPRDSAQSIRLAHSLVDRAQDEGGYLRQAWAMTAHSWLEGRIGKAIDTSSLSSRRQRPLYQSNICPTDGRRYASGQLYDLS